MFEVTVNNDSDQFAAFQLELSAAGTDTKMSHPWYRIAPSVSSKIPSGDQTRFYVEIFDIPPISSNFTGTMNLTVRVFSLELRDEDRQVMRLVIEGTGVVPPKLDFPTRKFQVYPGNLVEIPLQVQNLNRQATDVVVVLSGLEPRWFQDGMEKHLYLQAGETAQFNVVCHIPDPAKAPSRPYVLVAEARQAKAVPVQAEALLTILPMGYVELVCEPMRQQIPMRSGTWKNPGSAIATYDLGFTSYGNVPQRIEVHVEYELPRDNQTSPLVEIAPPLVLPPPPGTPTETGSPSPGSLTSAGTLTEPSPAPPAETVVAPPVDAPRGHYLSLTPAVVDVAVGETQHVTLSVRRHLPWLGWPRMKRLRIKGLLSDTRLELRNAEPTLELRILPVIPFWLQILAAVSGLLLAVVVWWWMHSRGHADAVNSVEFNGQGTEVISVSNDQSVIRWWVEGKALIHKGALYEGDKAIRVVRYRPVGNDTVWLGFENGDIGGLGLLNRQQFAFSFAKDDRIFDLVMSQDGRTLYSGHGSGLVLAWNTSPDQIQLTEDTPQRKFQTDFAVRALALMGEDENQLAIAGRFNQLVLFNLADDSYRTANYPMGGTNDYILDLATAAAKPDRVVVADNQGQISIWDFSRCMVAKAAECEVIDQWPTPHGGEAVQSVALTDDGCYLVSGGDDGRVMLWPLSTAGGRLSDKLEGEEIRRSKSPINSVDVIRKQNQLFVVSGGDDHKVRLNIVKLKAGQLAPGQCDATSP